MLRKRNEPIQKGDRYKWLWFGYDDTIGEAKEVLSANGKNELQFIFSGECIVLASIKQEEGETICELQQTMPMDTKPSNDIFSLNVEKDGHFT